MSGGAATVRPVDCARDFEAFFRLPWRIYRGDPLWVPPIKSGARAELSAKTNPFLRHCDFQLFILERGGRTVGRIAAMVDKLAVEAWGQSIGMFAYFECAAGAVGGGSPSDSPSVQARGDAAEGSDYDLVVVLDERTRDAREAVLDAGVEMLNRYDRLFAALVYGEDEWRATKRFPLGWNIEHEGVVV